MDCHDLLVHKKEFIAEQHGTNEARPCGVLARGRAGCGYQLLGLLCFRRFRLPAKKRLITPGNTSAGIRIGIEHA